MTPKMTKSAARYVKCFTETIGTMRASVDRHDTLEPVQPIEHDDVWVANSQESETSFDLHVA